LGVIQFIDRLPIAALELHLHSTFYKGNALRLCLEKLTQHSFFKYVVFAEQGTRRFRGLMAARELLAQVTANPDLVVQLMSEGTLEQIVGVQTEFIASTSSRRDALKQMVDKQLAEISVVDDHKQFLGIVDRDKLTSSILLEVATRP
jgi:CBS-domain-containing membrane protein